MKLKLPQLPSKEEFVVGFKKRIIKVKDSRKVVAKMAHEFVTFGILILLYVLNTYFITKIFKLRIFPRDLTNKFQMSFSKFYLKVVRLVDKQSGISISKLDLIHLALRNMQVKKARTLITIGGVAIGIGAIVFLVSIGYGLKQLVLTRVARLEELKQADVSPQPGSRVRINDKTISDVKSFPNVAQVYPLIAVVGRVNYQNSISDMAVFGVTTGYLQSSSVKTVQGQLFDSESISITSVFNNSQQGEVAGASTLRKDENGRISGYIGKELGQAVVSIYPETWLRVRTSPSVTAPVLGFTQRPEGSLNATQVLGSSYFSDDGVGVAGQDVSGNDLGLWVKAKFQIWLESPCDVNALDCYDGKYIAQRDSNDAYLYQEGYIAQINMNVEELPSVLGISTDDSDSPDISNFLAQDLGTTLTSSSAPAADPYAGVVEDENGWVVIPDENSENAADNIKKAVLPSTAIKKAVVNRAMLKVINLPEEEAVGKKFSTSFVLPTDLLEDQTQRVESVPEDYEIVGVTPDDSSPIFYVPFVDLRSLGIVNFSQFKIVSADEPSLEQIREQVGVMGYTSQSVQDTVEQINSLFDTIVLVLGSMGMIALAVSALGMFNTLTVSLLERTREVGLMKAMGMRTDEVQELFLTESMIMGFSAGFFGLLIGFVGGKFVSLGLTFFAAFKGQGFINVSHIPWSFVMLIMFLSLCVGLFTGIFPAQRSKNISALNALRYE